MNNVEILTISMMVCTMDPNILMSMMLLEYLEDFWENLRKKLNRNKEKKKMKFGDKEEDFGFTLVVVLGLTKFNVWFTLKNKKNKKEEKLQPLKQPLKPPLELKLKEEKEKEKLEKKLQD